MSSALKVGTKSKAVSRVNQQKRLKNAKNTANGLRYTEGVLFFEKRDDLLRSFEIQVLKIETKIRQR